MGQFSVSVNGDGGFKVCEMTPNPLGVGRRFLLPNGGMKDQHTVDAPVVVEVVHGPVHFVGDRLNNLLCQREREKGAIGSGVAPVPVGPVRRQCRWSPYHAWVNVDVELT